MSGKGRGGLGGEYLKRKLTNLLWSMLNRMNPFSVSWYVPLLGGEDGEWESLDEKFRRRLPDELYAARLVYRGLLMRACGRLKRVDGLNVSVGERIKAGELLGRIDDQRRQGRNGIVFESERRSKGECVK